MKTRLAHTLFPGLLVAMGTLLFSAMTTAEPQSGTHIRAMSEDDEAAYVWYLQATERGRVYHLTPAGTRYEISRYQPKTNKEKEARLRAASEQNVATAQYALGLLYDKGDGVPQNPEEAARWFRRAAEQGHALSQNYLGFFCKIGRGVPQNDKEAAQWFRKAARQLASAQGNLGLMYAEGRGVPQDDVQAYMWLDIAIASDEKGLARMKALGLNLVVTDRESDFQATRDQIAKRMTPAKIAQAQELASQWQSTVNMNGILVTRF